MRGFPIGASTMPYVVASYGALNGAVTDENGGAVVGGGFVDVVSGGAIVASMPIDPVTGLYGNNHIPSGAFNLQCHPKHTYGIGTGALDVVPIVLAGGATVTTNFAVRLSYFFDDLQGYADTVALKNTVTGLGATLPFENTVSFSNGGGLGAVELDPTGGPTGERCMRYDWPDRTGQNTNFTVGFDLHVKNGFRNVSPTGQLWARCYSRETLGFHEGDAGLHTSMAYKFMRAFFLNPGFADCDFGFNVTGNGSTTGYTSAIWLTFMEDARSGVFPINNPAWVVGDNNTTFDNQWHSHVMGITGLGTGAAMSFYYRDGALMFTMGPYDICNAPGGNAYWAMAFGNVMNNGPDQVQSRFMRELGVYFTRPSLKAGLV